jgi:Predicted secreted Zn-dependent protease
VTRTARGRLVFAAVSVCVACVATPAVVPKTVDGIQTLVDTQYYPVYGTTPTEWSTSARREAARAGVRVPALAMTGFVMNSFYRARTTEYGCEPHDPSVILGIRFVMPHLASDTGVSGDNRAAWDALMRALWIHESAHATVATRSAVEFRDSLRVMHSGECGLMTSHVTAVHKEIQDRYEALQKVVDDRRRLGTRAVGEIAAFRGTFLSIDTTFRDSAP